jgi:hypothetical protein
MPDLVIRRPDASEFSSEAATLKERATKLVVRDKFTHALALEALRDFRGLKKRMVDHFEPTRAALDKAKKEWLRARDLLVEGVDIVISDLVRQCDRYEADERRREAQERARLEAEAREREEEKRLLDAALADEAGEPDEAQAILQAPIIVPVPEPISQRAEVEGISSQTRWSAEVTDKLALVIFISTHPEFIDLLDVNQPGINRLAVSLRASMNIPGIRPVAHTVRVVRSV